MIKKYIKILLHAIGFDVKKYTPPNYGWIKERNITVVIDIGANIGQFAKLIDDVLPGVRIYSFEPIKSCYDELVKKCRSLNLKAFNFALGEKEDKTEIHVSQHSPSSSLLEMAELHKELYEYTQLSTKESIVVKTLDGIASELNLSNQNYMVKIDVQGFEDKVIKGGENTIKNAQIILIEMSYQTLYNGQLLFSGLNKFLEQLGFEFAGNFEQYTDPNNGRVVYSDSIFLKRKTV